MLEVEHENNASAQDTALDKRKRNAQRFVISTDQFEVFCANHHHLSCFVPESNELMASSYLILDEYLCFLDKGAGGEKQSSCILDVGVEKAMQQVFWDENAFKHRGGLYDWSKELGSADECSSGRDSRLEW